MPIIKKVRPTYGPQSKTGGHQSPSRGGQLLGVGICLLGLWGLSHIAKASVSPEGCPVELITKNPHEIAALYNELHNFPAGTIESVIIQESGWDVKAHAPDGGMGLMQLQPETAKACGVKHPYDPEENIKCGSKWLANSVKATHSIKLGCAVYNGSMGAANYFKKHGFKRNPKAPRKAWSNVTAQYVHDVTERIDRSLANLVN